MEWIHIVQAVNQSVIQRFLLCQRQHWREYNLSKGYGVRHKENQSPSLENSCHLPFHILFWLLCCYLVAKSYPPVCDPMDYRGAQQASLSMGFPRQECWTGLPFPSLGDLPDPGIEPMSHALAGSFLTTEPLR